MIFSSEFFILERRYHETARDVKRNVKRTIFDLRQAPKGTLIP
jgi:hypothetical protein